MAEKKQTEEKKSKSILMEPTSTERLRSNGNRLEKQGRRVHRNRRCRRAISEGNRKR